MQTMYLMYILRRRYAVNLNYLNYCKKFYFVYDAYIKKAVKCSTRLETIKACQTSDRLIPKSNTYLSNGAAPYQVKNRFGPLTQIHIWIIYTLQVLVLT